MVWFKNMLNPELNGFKDFRCDIDAIYITFSHDKFKIYRVIGCFEAADDRES